MYILKWTERVEILIRLVFSQRIRNFAKVKYRERIWVDEEELG